MPRWRLWYILFVLIHPGHTVGADLCNACDDYDWCKDSLLAYSVYYYTTLLNNYFGMLDEDDDDESNLANLATFAGDASMIMKLFARIQIYCDKCFKECGCN